MMSATRTWCAALAAALALLLSLPAVAAPPTPAQRCLAAKLLAAGGEARARLGCEQRGLATGADASCVARAVERREKAFARADARGGCASTGDSAAVGAAIDDLVVALLSQLRPGGPAFSRCTRAQLGAAARAIQKLAQAYARDSRRPDPARLANDLAKAEAGLASAWGRAAAKGDCLSATTAAEAWATLIGGIDGVRGILVPTCGDGVQGPGEACDGSTCPDLGSSSEYGCSPPGSSNACDCCANEAPCYVRGFGLVEPLEIPCCEGSCPIPGPEAGPNVEVFCTPPPAACPCWSSASLDAAFPPGFFDQEGRGGLFCSLQIELIDIEGFGANDSCTLFGPAGQDALLPRGGAAVVPPSTCLLFPDLDPDDDGICSGPPLVEPTTAEESDACIAELRASQIYQTNCP